MSTTRNYYITRSAVGTKNASIRIEIDTVGDGTDIVATAQYNLQAERDNLL